MIMRGLGYFVGAIVMFATLAVADEMAAIHVDLATLESSNDLLPVDGLTSSGQPDAEQLALFAEAGYVAVVDLRGESENRGLDEAAAVESLGLDYVNLPVSGADAISWENASQLEEILSSYDGPVLVHCGSGNRVGALLALSKSKNGAEDEEAVAYGRAAGMTGLESVVRSRLAVDE
jgi:uncharacterized protein (TIGR01244 family)